MFLKIKSYVKRALSLFLNLIGWCLLLLIWCKFMFHPSGIQSTYHTIKILILWAAILLILCIIWNFLHIENQIFHNELHSNYIRMATKGLTWAEITLDTNKNKLQQKERMAMICKQEENNLTSIRKLSYSAILIRDGYIKEAISLLRQILCDPHIGQLARKIAESELNLIFEDGNHMKDIKNCSITADINEKVKNQFQLSLLGYNRKNVDEYLNELMTYCWNLEEENKELKNDLTNYNNAQQKNISYLSTAKWEEKEYSLLLGLTLQEDILDYKGNVICEKNTIITSQLIESLISKGLYGELVAAADPSKGVERVAR
jgi:hypothetical protein